MRHRILGLIGVGLIGLSLVVVFASYNRIFVPVVPATVIADRSGLLLDPKSDVTLHGVTIGEARTVESAGGKAVIRIAIDREHAGLVPEDVSARIVAPTVFGTKFIELVPPPAPSRQVIAAESTIRTENVGTETNSVFQGLIGLLTAVKPAKMNATLGAMATALRGQGERLGTLVSDLNTYLTRFTPTLPALDEDLRALPEVAETYADVAPDLTRITGNTTTLSRTVQDEEVGLGALLLSLRRTSDDGRAVLNDHGQQLVDLLDTMRPTSQLLSYYSPTFPCALANSNALRLASAQSVGGQYNGIHGVITLMPGQEGYQKGADDPVMVPPGAPPRCYPGLVPYGPHYEFPDGTTTPDFYRQKTEVVSPLQLAKQMLGPAIEPYVDGGR
nr:MCE family protein [Saccharopolyspora sp. HNM0983]